MIQREDHATRTALSGLEAKMMKIMAENSQMRTQINRQTTLLTALQARLEELEDVNGITKENRKAEKKKKKEEEDKIAVLEERVRALERVVNGQRARSRGQASGAASTAAVSSLCKSLHGSACNSLSKSLHRGESQRSINSTNLNNSLSKSLHHGNSSSDFVYRSKTANSAVAGCSSPTRSTMTKARLNRMANAAAVSAVMEDESNSNFHEGMDDNDGSLSMSGAFLDLSESFVHNNNNNNNMESIRETSANQDEDGFPILSATQDNAKNNPNWNPHSSLPNSQNGVPPPLESPRRHSTKSEGRRKNRRASMTSMSTTTSSNGSVAPSNPTRKSHRTSLSKTTSTTSNDSGNAVSSTTSSESSSNSKAKSADRHDLCQPFTPDQIAAAQAKDEKLLRFLENPGAEPLYPKFTMSVVNKDDKKIYMFRKRIYVPAPLRQATMEHYYQQHKQDDNWVHVLCKQKVWPTIDTDITDFASRHK